MQMRGVSASAALDPDVGTAVSEGQRLLTGRRATGENDR